MIAKYVFLLAGTLVGILVGGYYGASFHMLTCLPIPYFRDFSVYISVFLGTLWGGILGYIWVKWRKSINFKKGVLFIIIATFIFFLYTSISYFISSYFEDFSVYIFIFLGALLIGILGYMGIKWWKNINFRKGVVFITTFILFLSTPPRGKLYWGNISRFLLSQLIFVPIAENLTTQTLANARKNLFIYFKENGKYPGTLDILYEEKAFLFGWNVILPLGKKKVSHQLISYKYLIVKTNPNQEIQPDQITDEGGWIYSPNSGNIRINCSHKDSKGVPYYEW